MATISNNLSVVIMAAGKGTRMKSDLPKVLHRLKGRPMIHYVLETARRLEAEPIVVIVGHQREKVFRELDERPVKFAVQEPQLGTGHAIQCALPELDGLFGQVLILSGDVPFLRTDTLRSLLEHHCRTQASMTVLTARTDDPQGYGRIVRQDSRNLEAIIEERDATENILRINEINSGIYIFELQDLRMVLPMIRDDNDQKEYYLTDAVRLLRAEGKTVAGWEGDFKEVLGINTVQELHDAERELP